MTFRDGLIRARGQIAFILALAVSTGVIIQLERISAQETLDRQVAERLTQEASALARTPQARQQALLALAQADLAQPDDSSETLRDLSLASALSAAALSGGIEMEAAEERARVLWERLAGVGTREAASARAILLVVFPEFEGASIQADVEGNPSG